MAFKLKRRELKRRDELIAELSAKRDKLASAIEKFNSALYDLKEELQPVIDDYNATLDALNSFRDEIVSRLDSEYESKSERWREGDRGLEAIEFIESWEALDADNIEIELPDDLGFDVPNHAEELSELPLE